MVLHASGGILDIVYMAITEPNAPMISNAVLRFAVVARRVVGRPPSPDARHQPVVHLLRVLVVPGEFLPQHLLLVVDAEDE
jgi:hypothetical protein